MKRVRRPIEVFSLSFLDVISCGFGAIILLLVIMKVTEPQLIETISKDLSGEIDAQQQRIATLKQNIQQTRLVTNKTTELIVNEQVAIRLSNENLSETRTISNSLYNDSKAQDIIIEKMQSAKQQLSDEIKRLQKHTPITFPDSVIGGVPVDSEYIIFIIDTSGSMQQHAWPLVRVKMEEILKIYPKVKGLQVMNDMGEYMFSQYAGKWIRDTPSRRKSIIKRLTTWQVFSNSSPVEGITAAIKRFYSPDKKISLFVFGDDFSRGSIQDVVNTVTKVNSSNSQGGKVRIHAVGFPVLFTQSGASSNIARFSALMRRLAEDNNGSFVGLNSLKDH